MNDRIPPGCITARELRELVVALDNLQTSTGDTPCIRAVDATPDNTIKAWVQINAVEFHLLTLVPGHGWRYITEKVIT